MKSKVSTHSRCLLIRTEPPLSRDIGAVDRITGVIASEIAGQIRSTVAHERWEDVIRLLMEDLLGEGTSG